MQLSTRSRYGLRALLDIAVNSNGNPVLLREIAERQDISKPYLEQLILLLQSAGILRSIRGKKGGFLLIKPPSEIKLIDIVKALERTLSFVDCVDDPQSCHRSNACITQKLWRHLTETMRNELEMMTLQDLIDWQNEPAACVNER